MKSVRIGNQELSNFWIIGPWLRQKCQYMHQENNNFINDADVGARRERKLRKRLIEHILEAASTSPNGSWNFKLLYFADGSKKELATKR